MHLKNHRLSKHIQTWTRARSFGRFAAIGVINTIVGMGCFPVLYWWLTPAIEVDHLLVASWTISTAFAFLTHKYITFKSREFCHREMMKFMLLSLATLGINLAVMTIMTRSFHAHPVVVQVATTMVLSGVLMILSYLGMNHLIFKPREGSCGTCTDQAPSKSRHSL